LFSSGKRTQPDVPLIGGTRVARGHGNCHFYAGGSKYAESANVQNRTDGQFRKSYYAVEGRDWRPSISLNTRLDFSFDAPLFMIAFSLD